ncbi:MAG: hypothetical protein KBD90_04770, partial [Alphaproteobacteria bacterium]|nr:hypothetical protein [Alphaproteobacteria bacterium]
NLEALASLYVKGYEIDWNLLHQGEAHQKISLPTYPFLKKKCWVSMDNKLRSISHHDVDFIGSSKLHSSSDSSKSTFEGQIFKKIKQPYQDDTSLHQATQNYLKEAFASITKVPYETIDISQPLETYGIDSILFVVINQRLRKAIPNLSKTILFEHKTIEALADYLACHHTNSLIEVLEAGNSYDNSALKNNSSDSLKIIQTPQQEDQAKMPA